MLNPSRKKHNSSNINININLKLQAKQHAGRKIDTHAELHKNQQQRPTLQNLTHKKYSQQHADIHKQSIQEFLDEKNIYEEQQTTQRPQPFTIKYEHKTETAQKNRTDRKKLKSKSLGNLKVKYYPRTPEPHSQSKSKSKSKSQSRSKANSQSKSKQRSDNKGKTPPLSHSKSRSKSPLLSKKRSLLPLKPKQEFSSKQLHKQKSKEKKELKNQNKKTQHSQPSFERAAKTTPNVAKKSTDLTQRNKPRKSTEKMKPKQSPKKYKPAPSAALKPKGKKQKKGKESKIYPQPFLDRMATKIQSAWRGYLVRKHFKNELNQISTKIANIKHSLNLKPEHFWQSHSNHSIIQLQSDFNLSDKTHKNISQRSNSDSMNPQFLLQLQKLRKRLQQQQDMFKQLAEQNNQLKANLSKITQQHPEPKKQRTLIVNPAVVSMRIETEDSEPEKQEKDNEEERNRRIKKKKEQMQELEPAIRTEQSKEEEQEGPDRSSLKKKLELFCCSPRNQTLTFNKSLIRKLFTQHEQKLHQKYFKQNDEYKHLLQNQLVSPKTYHQKCNELARSLKLQKQQNLIKYQEAEKALTLITELQEENSQQDLQKSNENVNSNSARSEQKGKMEAEKKKEENSPPGKKVINLFINVDQIDANHDKYTPIITHNSHREHQLEKSREEDLSQLYHKVMEEQEQGQQLELKSPENPSKEESTEVVNLEITQYPEFQLQSPKLPKKIQGFETSLHYIRLFYLHFCEFFRQIPDFKDEILSNITEEMTFDQEHYLHSFRIIAQQNEQDNTYVFPYFKFLATYNTAVPVHILNSYYSEITNEQSSIYNKHIHQLKKTSKQEYQELGYSSYELKQYYDLALIDAFNEAINNERPGGTDASNLDQLTHHYRSIYKQRIANKISPNLPETEQHENLSSILGSTIATIVNQWASSLCGFINDSEDCSQRLSESRLQQIRNQRQTIFLQHFISQEQNIMTDTHPFRLQSKLELANFVFSFLVYELSKEMDKLFQ